MHAIKYSHIRWHQLTISGQLLVGIRHYNGRQYSKNSPTDLITLVPVNCISGSWLLGSWFLYCFQAIRKHLYLNPLLPLRRVR